MASALLPADNPKYLEIAEHLRRDIESGTLRAGDRLPTFVELRRRFETTPSTVDRAHTVLEREGLIERGQGRRGTRVVGPRTTQRRHVIGCMGVDFRLASTYPYWTRLLGGMQHVAETAGFELLMLGGKRRTDWDKMDGVVLHGELKCDPADRPPASLPTVSTMLPVDGVSSVVADDFEGTRRATEHLLQLGHRRIGALMFKESPLPRRRLTGYRAALHDAGIAPDESWVWPFAKHAEGSPRMNARLSMAEWLSQDWKRSGVTAVLAQNDEVALGIMDALAEAGLRVPDDVSVIGFDGTEEGENAKPALTSVTVPLDNIGATAMELLLRQIRQEPVEPNVITLPTRLHVRGSTGSAPQ